MLLKIDDLSVEVEGKKVLENVSLGVESGEVVALTGPNGGGKSSLAGVLAGLSGYRVKGGEIELLGENLLELSIDERARAGLVVAWQSPASVPGVKVFNLSKAAVEARGEKIGKVVEFKERLEKLLERVGLPRSYVGRSVNEGFSGGERKRLELVQLLLLSPKLVILDEVDSGLDEEGREMLVGVVEELAQGGVGVVVITHYGKMLERIKVSKKLVMRDGRLQTGR